MKRLILSSLVLALLVGMAGFAVARSSSAAAAPKAAAHPQADEPMVKTIVFRAREPFPPQFFDIAKPSGLGPGDEGIEKEILTVNGKRVGYDLIHFSAITAPPPDVIAQGVLILRGGQIALQGETTFEHIRVAVVGGTGIYQGVSGQLTVLRTLPGEVDVDQLRLVFPED
ncbi:MAG TPA: hypothetical protein VE777_15870 [Gaiellales bacterium]|jgi:hypothetical protein|nr:hypothetical protein [Gaiellales bacterium]